VAQILCPLRKIQLVPALCTARKRSQGVMTPPNIPAYLVVLCFQGRFPEQNTVARFESKSFALPRIVLDWLRHWYHGVEGAKRRVTKPANERLFNLFYHFYVENLAACLSLVWSSLITIRPIVVGAGGAVDLRTTELTYSLKLTVPAVCHRF